MTPQEGGVLDEDGSVDQPAWTQEQRAQTKEQTIGEAEIRGASARTAEDQELVPEQEIFGY
jgi:hypothetical protein